MNCRARLGSKNLRRLDTSNGCQDHTVLPYASAPFVCRAFCSLTDVKPALRTQSAPDAAASTASHPNVYDDPDTPLVRDEMAGFLILIWEKDNFLRRGLPGQITLNPFNKSLSGDRPVPRACIHYSAPHQISLEIHARSNTRPCIAT